MRWCRFRRRGPRHLHQGHAGASGASRQSACGSRRSDSTRGVTKGDALPRTVVRRGVVGGIEAVVLQCIAQTVASATMARGRTGGWSSRSGRRRPWGPRSRRRGRRGNTAGGSGGDAPQRWQAAGGNGRSAVVRGRSHDARGPPGPGRAGLLRVVRAVRRAGTGRVGRAVRVGRAARRVAAAVAVPEVRRAHGPRAHQGQSADARRMTDGGNGDSTVVQGGPNARQRRTQTGSTVTDENTRRRAGSAVVGGCPTLAPARMNSVHRCDGQPSSDAASRLPGLRVGVGVGPPATPPRWGGPARAISAAEFLGAREASWPATRRCVRTGPGLRAPPRGEQPRRRHGMDSGRQHRGPRRTMIC